MDRHEVTILAREFIQVARREHEISVRIDGAGTPFPEIIRTDGLHVPRDLALTAILRAGMLCLKEIDIDCLGCDRPIAAPHFRILALSPGILLADVNHPELSQRGVVAYRARLLHRLGRYSSPDQLPNH